MSDAEAANRTRTLLVAGLAVVVLAALVIFVILPLLSGDDDGGDDTDVVVVDDESPQPLPSPTEDFELADPGEVEGDPPAETFEVFNARDPFQQLVDASATTVDGTGTGAPTFPPTGTPTTTPTTPTTPAPGATTPPTGSTPPPTGSSPDDNGSGTDGSTGSDGSSDGSGSDGSSSGSDAQVGGTTVTLVDVFTDDDGERTATVTVNGTGYNVGEGETFGRRFRLLDISGRCATMLFGDSRFTLCEGERIRK